MHKTTLIVLFALFSLTAFSLSACGSKGGPTEVHVKLSEFKIEMDKTSIPAGPVKFIIDNAGNEKHEVVIEPAGANDKALEAGGKAAEAENIQPGASATLEWTIDQAGDYQLGCHINENNEDHYALGMVTTFTVTKP